MPDKITIDYSRYAEKYGSMPSDGAVAAWHFLIDEDPYVVTGSFAEACSKAKLYVRLYDAGESTIALADKGPHPRVKLEVAP